MSAEVGRITGVLQVEDDASPVIEGFNAQVQSLGVTANTTTGSMASLGTTTTATSASFLSQMGAITSVTGGLMAFGLGVYSVERTQNMLDRANVMVQRDTETVQKAQEAYTVALANYGPTAQKTIDAAAALSIAQNKLSVDTDRASLSQQNYNIQLLQVATFGIPMLLTALAKVPAAYDAIAGIGGKIAGLTSSATEAGVTAPVEAEAVGTTAAGTAAAATLGTVAVGAAAGAAEIQGLSTVLGDMNEKAKAGTLSLNDVAAAFVSTATPVQLMTQGISDFLAKAGLIPTQTQTVGTQTIQNFQNMFDKIVGGSIWPDMWNEIIKITGTSGEDINSLMSRTTETTENIWGAMLSAMVSATESKLQAVYDVMNAKLNAIIAAVQAAKQQISSGSIWPDMLDEMVAQTHEGMTAIQEEFAAGFESPRGIIPTIQAGGQTEAAPVAAPSAAPATAEAGSQAITIPIVVNLDGQQIQTFLEKRIVDTIYRDAGRGKRGKA